MKVLLLKDVYNLGRAGEVRKVADGYGRNFLLPQKLAVLASPNALKQAEAIRQEADKRRAVLNQEMAAIADKIKDVQLHFPARAGETGKLYGSVTTQMIADELTKSSGIEIAKRQIDSEPLRQLGLHTIKVRLTMDVIPTVKAVVFREGESAENYMIAAEELAELTSAALHGDQEAAREIGERLQDAPDESQEIEGAAESAETTESPAE